VIRFSNVSLRRGAKLLLEAAEVSINPGERIGLIGANGSGKSSLFALLRGELHTDRGEVDFPGHWRLAHVAQETPALERPAIEYAIDGDTTLRKVEERLAGAQDGLLIGELHAALADADAYTVRSRAERLLTGLGFNHEELERPVSSFSGGWRMRLNLAQALMCPSELLLPDEPTNHLDFDTLEVLERALAASPSTIVAVSHDRWFLDAIGTTRHLHVEAGAVYEGSRASSRE
jgi:ATP-binding cassette, subfamily F, member 3